MDLHTGFLVVQEMLGHGPQIVFYFGRIGKKQEYQLVHWRVKSQFLILWYDVKNFLFVVFLHNLLLGTSISSPSCQI